MYTVSKKRTSTQCASHNADSKRRYNARKSAGLCTVCGGVRDNSRLKCSACASKNNARLRRRYGNRGVREKQIADCKDRYDRLKSSGVCVRCGSGDSASGTMCVACSKKSLESSSRAFARRTEEGRCYTCGSESSPDLTASCRDCHEKRLVQSKAWGKANAEKVNAHKRARWKSDAQYRTARKLRSRFGSALRRYFGSAKKAASAVKDLGCTIEQLCAHLESKFQDGMTWTNYGQWHIDHIKPLAAFDLTDKEQQLRACHFANLQPLWAKDNFAKGCKYEN